MPEHVNCIITDDEPKMVELLADTMQELFPDIEISGRYTDWKNALKGIRSIQPDIIFMDISMPEKSGFDLLQLLPDMDSQVILVTAHTEFAVEAFSFDVCGYVLKPITDKALVQSVNRALNRIAMSKKVKNADSKDDRIGIPDDNGIRYVNINDIMYCETYNRYTKVVTTQGDIISSYNIGKYHDTLTQDFFVQLHRSFIVNINHIKRYDSSGTVIMNNGVEIPVSRKKKEQVLHAFNRIGR